MQIVACMVVLAVIAGAPAPAKKPAKKNDDWFTIAPASKKPDPSATKKEAAKKEEPPPAAKPTPPPAAQQPKAAPPVESAPVVPASSAVAEDLARARKLFDNLEYDQVIPIATAILERKDASIEQRLDAYMLEGSSMAIVGNTVDAETPFRFLLRGRPDFDMSPDTSPKILAVFRKVQVEEKAIVAQMRELERARLVSALKLDGDNPVRAEGGQPLVFEYKLKDPFRAVAEMKVEYRRRGEASYSSLALERDDTGNWKGQLPPEWTASEAGFQFEYFLTTSDERGSRLLTVASAEAPITGITDPGSLGQSAPFYSTPWFWIATGAAVVAGGVVGALVLTQGSRLPDTDLGEVHIK